MTVPLRLTPLPKTRVWGGRRLAGYGKALPEGPVGETWELVDREDEQSVVAGGPRNGRTLHELWTEERILFGTAAIGHPSARFPLLVKLLDARDTLSVQVHPPAEVAARLDGESKTEAWYVLEAQPEAFLLAGLRAGTDRAAFDAALEAGGEAVEALLHRIDVRVGDALLLPSGRLHALGAGCLVVEVQESSDTTYRVWDFERPGMDGEPRELHVEEALEAIDFDDHEPELSALPIDTDLFRIERWDLGEPRAAASPERCGIVVVLEGEIECAGEGFTAGDTFLVPATCTAPVTGTGALLHVTLP